MFVALQHIGKGHGHALFFFPPLAGIEMNCSQKIYIKTND